MNGRRGVAILLALIVAAVLARAAGEPVYDEKADARKQIEAAIARASQKCRPTRNVVLVFGANWCPDCHALDAHMRKPELAALLRDAFVVVNVDVGRMNRNVDVAQRYGVPVKRGIPALAVLDARGKLLYAMDQGQFSNARHMSYESIRAFFEQWKPTL